MHLMDFECVWVAHRCSAACQRVNHWRIPLCTFALVFWPVIAFQSPKKQQPGNTTDAEGNGYDAWDSMPKFPLFLIFLKKCPFYVSLPLMFAVSPELKI